MHFNNREDIIALTPHWTGPRLPDGRPMVDEKYLKALKTLTLEEVWKPIFVKGYESQFEGRLHTLHDDGRKLIGRAVTATYCPFRPDLDAVTKDIGRSENRTGTYNQWVIDNLMEYDVPVIDMYDHRFEEQNEKRKRRRGCLKRHPGHRADEKGRGHPGLLPGH